MVIVEPFAALVEAVAVASLACALRRVSAGSEGAPGVDELRPVACPQPECRRPARDSAGKLRLVGHGVYWRSVLGLLERVSIAVRRYLCLGCGHTASVLGDVLHPRRRYAAVVIIEILWQRLILATKELAVAASFGRGASPERWRAPARWQRDLLASPTLLGWLGPICGARGPAGTRAEAARRLAWLLSYRDERTPPPAATRLERADVWRATRGALAGVRHDRARAWPPGREAPARRLAANPGAPRLRGPTLGEPDIVDPP